MIPDITGAAARLRRGAAASFIVGQCASTPDRTPGSVWRRPDRREVARAARTLAVATWLVVSTFTGRVLADVPFLGGSTVAAGMHHSCAVTSAGGAKCWGFNAEGQLGIGSTENALVPTEVAGLASGVSKVSTGHFHSCALTTTGAVKCWGGNGSGQAGTGSGSIRHLHPEQVVGLLAGARSVVANGNHACAITASGGVKCWGTNYRGQLGTGGSLPGADSRTPVDVVGLSSGVVAIAAGANHSCAVTSAGGMRCWGANEEGQLGNGSNATPQTVPGPVAGLSSGGTGIATGAYHSCAVTVGGVRCWGLNTFGQLGNGSGPPPLSVNVPTSVSGLPGGVGSITSRGNQTCVIAPGGGVHCWGSNVDGELGDGGAGYYEKGGLCSYALMAMRARSPIVSKAVHSHRTSAIGRFCCEHPPELVLECLQRADRALADARVVIKIMCLPLHLLRRRPLVIVAVGKTTAASRATDRYAAAA